MTPDRSYLVCATPRSGSTLLCHLLDRTGVAGRPAEYFEALQHSGLPRRPTEYFDRERHANIVERLAFREMPDERSRPTPNPLWSPETYDRYLAWAIDRGTTPNGIFGAKLMWGYLGDFAHLLRGIRGLEALPVPQLFTAVFPDLRYVQITRTDKVRQAVSLWKAVQTQAWQRDAGSASNAATGPEFSFRAINYLVRLLTAHDASWDAYFLGLGLEPLKVTYEELAGQPEPIVRRVLEHLEIGAPETLDLGAPRLEAQADELSEDWVRRVHEHLAALETPT
ncbi:MAG: trehalose 2-sulfotransferase [Solirubrobacteraceae bacterium]|jgi:LPS sulfotransferase NodH|nr:trehalose 2-sulfotransferase [Solirubrobacteraceae bacterium]